MKRLFKLFCLFFLMSGNVLGKTSIKDLRKSLLEAKDDAAKITAYIGLIKHYAYIDRDSAKYYSDAGIAYAVERKYSIGEGEILQELGMIDRSQGRINIAERRLSRALELFKQEKDTNGISDVLSSLGSIEFTKGNIDIGARYTVQSVKLAEKVDNKHVAVVGYMNLGTSYLQQSEFDNAEKYFNKAAEISKEMPLSESVINLYNLVGILHAYRGELDKALEIFQRDLELSSKNNLVGAHVECLQYLGQFYFEAGDMAKSMSYFQQGLEIAKEKQLEEMKSDIWLQMALISVKTNHEEAEQYMEKALEVAQKMSNGHQLASIYENQVIMYKEMGEFEKALDATLKRQKIVDSFFSVNKSIELAEISAEYELEKADMKVRKLEETSRHNMKERNFVIGIAIGVIVLLLVVVFFYRKTIVLNQQLEKHQSELKELNAMKDKLFSVVGHDLRGPIARIPTILDIYEDEETSEEEKQYLLDSLRDHTKASMEMLDKLLFWGQTLVKGITMQEQKVLLKDVVGENIALRKLSLEEKAITATEHVEDDTVVNADATHVDFIVRNLIANAIKYTKPGGNISISAEDKSKPGFVVLSVKDDGVGIAASMLPTMFKPLKSQPGTADEQGSGIGLMLCKEFAELNGGEMWVESTEGKGATFYLALKKAV